MECDRERKECWDSGTLSFESQSFLSSHSFLLFKTLEVNSLPEAAFPWVGRRFHGKESSPLEAIRELG